MSVVRHAVGCRVAADVNCLQLCSSKLGVMEPRFHSLPFSLNPWRVKRRSLKARLVSAHFHPACGKCADELQNGNEAATARQMFHLFCSRHSFHFYFLISFLRLITVTRPCSEETRICKLWPGNCVHTHRLVKCEPFPWKDTVTQCFQKQLSTICSSWKATRFVQFMCARSLSQRLQFVIKTSWFIQSTLLGSIFTPWKFMQHTQISCLLQHIRNRRTRNNVRGSRRQICDFKTHPICSSSVTRTWPCIPAWRKISLRYICFYARAEPASGAARDKAFSQQWGGKVAKWHLWFYINV